MTHKLKLHKEYANSVLNGEKTFGEICDEKNSEIYGGSMVRCIRRLDELIKE